MHAIGIVGASGYSGEWLVAALTRHPHVALRTVASHSHAGARVDSVLPGLTGKVGDLCFTPSDPLALAADDSIHTWFLALPHGVAAAYALPLVAAGRTVIDLSADFRLSAADVYQDYYGEPHPAPDWLPNVPYVLPELSGTAWKDQQLIACPGCYPTSVLLPLVPLLRAGLIDPGRIVIHSMSGVSGAGKKATAYYSYCERDGSVTAYGMPRHRHLAEIEEQLSLAAGSTVIVQFTPHLVPMSRGIATTITVPALETGSDAVYQTWQETYADCPFIRLLPSGQAPDTRHVTGTNRADFSAVYDSRTGNLVITSAIDNLIKGAGGQAVQIFNLLAGLPETAGLP